MSADRLLAVVPLFQSLRARERAALAAALETVHVPAGETLFNFGDPGGSLYIIRSGEIEVFIHNVTGERIVLERGGEGEVVGEIALLDSGPRTASVIATQDVEALRLDREDMEQFLRQYPEAALELLGVMARRLRTTGDQLRYTATRNVSEEIEERITPAYRVANWITRSSGSIACVLLHTVVFIIWLGGNSLLGHHAWDPPPFGLLTLILSVESIYLCVFLLLSQNREAAQERIRDEVEFDVNLKAELEIAHLHEKIDRMRSEILAELREPGRPAN